MRFFEQLSTVSQKNQSLLCIGLDPDITKLPLHLRKEPDPLFSFNKTIIENTWDLVCAYKPNSAFYEMYGVPGLTALKKTIDFIHSAGIPVILDAKRGDIDNSSAAYAKSAFEVLQADALTVNPYMGYDAIEPFLSYPDKGVFILCLTSNKGAQDFQTTGIPPLYQQVAQKVAQWNKANNCGIVAGATNSAELAKLRQILPDLPFLIPGIGAQGGNLAATLKHGLDKTGNNAIINVSRQVLYASPKEDFGQQARLTAQTLKAAINLQRKG